VPVWLLRGGGRGEAADGQDGDVVFLAEFLGGVGDVEGGLAGQVADLASRWWLEIRVEAAIHRLA
jgi:hypothetical protein